MRYFCWLLAHNSLLTNFGRWKRGMADTSDCHRRNDRREDVLHAVRDCPKAKEVWKLIVSHKLRESFFEWDLHIWLEKNMCFSDERRWGLD